MMIDDADDDMDSKSFVLIGSVGVNPLVRCSFVGPVTVYVYSSLSIHHKKSYNIPMCTASCKDSENMVRPCYYMYDGYH